MAYIIAFTAIALCLKGASMQRTAITGEDGLIIGYRFDFLSKILATLAVLILGLFYGLRSYTVGFDTATYVARYLSGEFLYVDLFAPGYMLLTMALRIFFPNEYPALLIAMGLLTSFFLIRALMHYCPIPWLGFFIILAFGYIMEGFNQYRQLLAMAILLNCISALAEDDLRKFLLLVLFAAAFHATALIFLIVWPFRRASYSFTTMLTVMLVAFGVYALFPYLARVLKLLPYFGQYIGSWFDKTGDFVALLNTLFRIALATFIVWAFQAEGEKSVFCGAMVPILLIAVVFQVGSLASTTLGRVCSYFVVFYAFAVPQALCSFNKALQRAMNFILVTALFGALLYANVQIKFTTEVYRYSSSLSDNVHLISYIQ